MFKVESEYDDLDKYKYSNGDIYYRKKDTNIAHNPYGPAVVHEDGFTVYYINNKLHRLDGPAFISSDGEEFYYINNKELDKEEFEKHPERLNFIGKGHLVCIG